MSKFLLKMEYFLVFWITVQQNRDGKQKDAQLQIIIIFDWGMKFCGLVGTKVDLIALGMADK